MSKRPKEGGQSQSHHGSNSARVSLLEQKLLELQVFTDDALNRKDGLQRSTRAYSDALLNVEIKLLRQREIDLAQRVNELEKSQSPSQQAEEMRRLTTDLEEMRNQFGEKTNQMRILQLEAKDKVIQNLTRSLAESKKETQQALKHSENLAAEVLLLQRQLNGLLGGGGGGGGDGDVDGDGDDFDAFLQSAAKSSS